MGCPRPNTPRSDPKDLGELVKPLRDALWTMMQDAPRKGLVLVSGYRDAGRQWDLRHDRCPGRECDPSCKGHPTTALPGRSNHGKRTAGDMGGRDLAWFVANVRRYGLHLPVRGENWHAELSGRSPSVRILTYPGWCYDAPAKLDAPAKPTPNAGRSWVSFSRVGTTDAQVYAAGGLDNQVATVQLMLRHPVTRVYTKADADAVKALKKIGRYVDPSGKADRSQAVTPDFAKVLAALSKVPHP